VSDHMTSNGSASPRTTVRRHPERGVYDRDVINAIIDEALICHVAIVDNEQPFVIPVIHTRVDDHLYLHGSRGSRLLRGLAAGQPACVCMTLIDGLVLARSAMHHSMNYRSVVVIARGCEVTDRAEKARIFDALVEHVIPGRSRESRPPSISEIDATLLVGLPLDEASAKVRSGPPIDNAEDLDLPWWAGVIPLELKAGPVISAVDLKNTIVAPNHATNYLRPARR
jgi:nitroimidazol reductase NimA-like FMN-containing flavoprotein (pyridoxamine 5'-phosphate oxidase superfamily)